MDPAAFMREGPPPTTHFLQQLLEEMLFHSGVGGGSTRVFSWLLCREVMIFHSVVCGGVDQDV